MPPHVVEPAPARFRRGRGDARKKQEPKAYSVFQAGKISNINKTNFTAYIDGACKGNPGPGAAAAVLYAGGAAVLERSKFFGNTTNNQAEYNALILALESALELGCGQLTVKTDSELVARQINGRYKVKNKKIIPLFEKARALAGKFESFKIIEIPREENEEADSLANKEIKRKKRI